MTRPTVGDFRGTDQNKPRPAPVAEAKEDVVGAEVETLSPDPTPKDSDFLTPAEKYLKRLGAMGISLEEARSIYDGVLSKGYYEEYIRLRGNNRAVFRTRQYDDHLRLQTILEMQKPQLAISQDEVITRFNLAASLFEWAGKELKHGTDEDFDAVMLLIKKMPGPLFSVLARELAKFDAKIMAIFEEGADENF